MQLKEILPSDPCSCGSGKPSADCCFRELFKRISKQAENARFPSPSHLKVDFAGYTNRVIWNRIYPRPKDETFQAFIVNVLKWTVGKKWYEEQVALPAINRHLIMKWIYAWHELMEKLQPLNLSPTDRVAPTGDVRELMALASDIYYLQLVHELPQRLKKRLCNYDQFQGARYEIAVAAAFVRSGFEIEWIDNKGQKHPEFNAKHKVTQEVIAVETKSRHRPGTLHQKGDLPDFTKIHADILSLYSQALQQAPDDKPFIVFIDINLPTEAGVALPDKRWVSQLLNLQTQGMLFPHTELSVCTILSITNSSWHYDGQNMASQGEYALLTPLSPSQVRHPLAEGLTFEAIQRALTKFGEIPEDE